MRRIITLVTALTSLAVAAAPASADPVKLSVKQTRPVAIAGQADTYFAFANNQPAMAAGSCGKGAVPIAVGWSGQNIPFTMVRWYVDSGAPSTKLGFTTSVHVPIRSGRISAIELCARGPVRATRKIGPSNKAISCGSKTALGYMSLKGPNQSEATSMRPNGRNGWLLTQAADPYANSGAVCVDRAAFTRVSSHSVAGAFKLNARTVKVKASCPRGKRAIAWGFAAPKMDQNAFPKAATYNMQAAFIESSVPSRNAWTLTFSTPDLEGAKSASAVSATVVCGIPRTA